MMREGVIMDNEKLVIRVEDGVPSDEALALSEITGAPLCDAPSDSLAVVFGANGVSLSCGRMSFCGDFAQMLRRLTGGHIQHEMLAHIAKTNEPHPTAVDATAGMGEDSIVFAACGYEVTMFEQNPVIALLLRDAMRRAALEPELEPIISRMHLIEGDSIALMPKLGFAPDLVYLDPMFPARQKSGLINKKLQLIQKLERPCVEEAALFDAALALGPKKLVIKRPLKGGFLAEKKPHYTINGKAIRYDCFAFPNN